VPRQNVTALVNGDKLQIVDPSAVIQRYACKDSGTHMYGRIENKGHPFYGLDFIHPEFGWAGPSFAALVSSVLVIFFNWDWSSRRSLRGVRARLKELGLEPYDCLSPALMDAIATHVAKKEQLRSA
jgi:S-(hydroxymethyl)glutathione synthase